MTHRLLKGFPLETPLPFKHVKSMEKVNIEVFYEATPNPQSLKFYFTEMLTDESVSFEKDQEPPTRSPIAEKIFGFPWASAVQIGPNFVTVTKQEWVDWKVLAEPLCSLIKEHIQSGKSLLLPKTEISEKLEPEIKDPLVKRITDFLNNEVRPAVAMDGGDIVFQKFTQGTLFVRMTGACSGCPSSMVTLKDGIEARIQEIIPEVKEVVAV